MNNAEDTIREVLTTAFLLLESTDESDSEEDELLDTICAQVGVHPHMRRSIPRIKNYVGEVIVLYNDREFKAHFRISRQTFLYMLTLIEERLMGNGYGRPTISPKEQLLVAIWKMATPDSYRSIAEKFGIARGSALAAVRRVTKALADLAPQFIIWPNPERAEESANAFQAMSGFPRILGAVDGTDITIPAPSINHDSYINRKSVHAIKLQGICDHTMRFIHCYAGQVGSVHDQRMFRLSEVAAYLNDPEKIPENYHLIGDAAYSLHTSLLVPFKNNGHLTARQNNYNTRLSSARQTIERAFGLLKGRFRSLLHCLHMQRIDHVPNFILACCVLHNVCLMRGDELEIAFAADQDNSEDDEEEDLNVRRPRAADVQARNRHAIAKRNLMCEQLPMGEEPVA